MKLDIVKSMSDLKKASRNIDQEQLFLYIKEQVEQGLHETLLSALNEYCEENDIDYDKINRFLHPSLKDLLYQEAVSRGMMSREIQRAGKLTVDVFEEESAEIFD